MATKVSAVRKQVEKFVKGTNVIKKVNFQGHLDTEIQKTATIRLKEKTLLLSSTANTIPGGNNQATLLPHVRKYTALQHSLQLYNYENSSRLITSGKSFKAYESFANLSILVWI